MGNKFNNVVFTDYFLSDIGRILPVTTKNSMYWNRSAVQEAGMLYVKFEDVLIDTEWGLVNYLRDAYRVTKENLQTLVTVIQTKDKKSLMSSPDFKKDPYWSKQGAALLKSINPLDIVAASPVHRPTLLYIQSLETIEYPYTLVCQFHKSFLRHPLANCLYPEAVIAMPDKPVRLKDTAFISDQVMDAPQMLYARPWNHKDFSKFKEKIVSFS